MKNKLKIDYFKENELNLKHQSIKVNTGDSCFYSPDENIVIGGVFIKLPFKIK
jgi:hypothetical protein